MTMTIREFLDAYLPTQRPEPHKSKKAWAGWITNLYIAASGVDATSEDVLAAMLDAGYEETEFSAADIVVVSEQEIGRADRKFVDKMLKNFRVGRGVR